MGNDRSCQVPRYTMLVAGSSFVNFPVANFFSFYKSGNMSPKYGTDYEENFQKFCSSVGISVENYIHIYPEHYKKIKIVGNGDRGIINCDGLITVERNVTLSLFPADCFPIIITRPKGDFVALIHGSQKTIENSIIAEAIKLSRSVTQSVDLLVAIGPGIKTCCYRTDLQKNIIEKLIESGVSEDKIFVSNVCTFCAVNEQGVPLFFSHRRSCMNGGEPEGRFAAVVARYQ